jgi:hypothetical protein
VTEPRPISTAGGRFSFDGMDSDGIAILSPARDALGVVVVRGAQLTVSVVLTECDVRHGLDYPALTVTVTSHPRFHRDHDSFDVDLTSLQFRALRSVRHCGRGGFVIGRMGRRLCRGVPTNVGRRDCRRRFEPTTRVKFNEIVLRSQVRRPPLAGDSLPNRHACTVKASASSTATGPKRKLLHQRTRRQGTSAGRLPRRGSGLCRSRCHGRLADSAGLDRTRAQNRQPAAALVAELLDASGRVRATATVRVRPGQYVLTELSELFGMAYSSSQVVRVRSDAPIQVMGVAVDAAGNASPIAAR